MERYKSHSNFSLYIWYITELVYNLLVQHVNFLKHIYHQRELKGHMCV